MDSLCRLCCSLKFVRNYIFNDATGLFNKISLYMPLKVFRNDELPQKICDKCFSKIIDFYNFCNQALETQKRLKAAWAATDGKLSEEYILRHLSQNSDINSLEYEAPLSCQVRQQATQTEDLETILNIKEEPRDLAPTENVNVEKYDDYVDNVTESFNHKQASEDSDNICLVDLQALKKSKKHKKRKKKDKTTKTRTRQKKIKLEENGILEKYNIEDNDKLITTKEELSSGDLWSEDETLANEWDLVPLPTSKQRPRLPDVLRCCMCEATKVSRPELLQHYQEHLRAVPPPAPTAPPAPPAPPADDPAGPWRCPRCKTSVAAAEWPAHWARHAARDARPLRCRVCERLFARPADVLRHGLKHRPEDLVRGAYPPGDGATPHDDRDLMCDICPEKFRQMRQLAAHRARAHASAAPGGVRCARCGQRFAHAGSLRRHAAAHGGRREHLCAVCGKALSSREHLKYHARVHSGYKPHVCKVCGKGFAKKCNLTLHERVHSGEKPHVCPVCRKGFSQRSTLTIHQRYHSGERPYTCSLCGRGFVARGLLSMHLKTICI